MTSITFFFVFIPILAVILLSVNLLLATSNPYEEKNAAFECGFTSFSDQSREPVEVMHFIVGMIFMLFDVELVLVSPFFLRFSDTGLSSLLIVMIFFFVLTLGFIFEIGKKALRISSKQNEYKFDKGENNNTYL